MGNSPARASVNRLVSGSAALAAATVITKVVGLFYRIPLVKYVGIEGMAYFLAANHIYVFLFVVSTSGLPVALSIMVSRATAGRSGDAEAGVVFRTAMGMFVIVGAVGTLFMMAAAEGISSLINIRGAARCICVIAPAIIMACISGGYRGYFQGRRIMGHTALSQVIEALGKLLLGLAGALFATRQGYDKETVAAFAIAGITAGVGLSMLYLAAAKIIFDRKHKIKAVKTKARVRGIAWRLLKISLPITLSSAVISLTGLIDTSLIVNCLLSAGFSEAVGNTLYSCYGNIAVPLFCLAPALVTPISMAAVPLISAALKSEDIPEVKKLTRAAYKLTLLAALPASVGLSVFSRPIIGLIFPGEPEAADIAAPLLSLLALSVVSACLITITNALLQASGGAPVTIISMLCGAGVKIASEYFLIRNPAINIAGAPISTFLCNLTVVGINMYFIARFVKGAPPLSTFLPASLSALIAVGAAVPVYGIAGHLGRGTPAILAALFAAAVIYAVAAVLTGAADRDFLAALPGLRRFLGPKQLKNKKKDRLGVKNI
ncbi:MAG TPA: polysaccharide biosynthesis protein [Clostridiales bacterium]|nr:polysaccharide biosynthesis protein [Clostridiales bacterium]